MTDEVQSAGSGYERNSPLEELLVDEKAELERGLPESQRKGVDPEESAYPHLPDVVREEAEGLSEVMATIESRTNADGTLRGYVVGIHSSGSNKRIAVMVDLPGQDEPERFTFTKPRVWAQRYQFVRFVEGYGYAPSNVHAMMEDRVRVGVREDDEGYSLVVPDERGMLRRAAGRVAKAEFGIQTAGPAMALGIAIAILTSGIVAWLYAAGDPPGIITQIFFITVIYAVGALAWLGLTKQFLVKAVGRRR